MSATPTRHTQPAFVGKVLACNMLGATLLLALGGCQSTSAPIYTPAIVVSDSAGERQANPASNPVAQASHSATRGSTTNQYGDKSSWLSSIDDTFLQARLLVEEQLDVALGDITLQVVEDAIINAEVARETHKLIHSQFGGTEYASQFLDQVMQPLAGTYAALYSPRLQGVLISRSMLVSYERSLAYSNDADTGDAALLTLLIHELVHAADDTQYNIHDNRELNFRASFAQSATFEGHAQWVTRQICKKVGCESGLTALDNFMFGPQAPADQLTQPMEDLSRNVLEYSYVEGEHFIRDLAARNNGQQLIKDALRNPPVDPIQILAPESFPDNARESRNQQLLAASRAIDHPLTSPDWVGIETSPLKGIDLRSDPVRRQAAIDGFTRLILGMVSLQFYDQGAPGASPVEATILQAESADTARLFANVLHKNTHQQGAEISDESVSIETGKAHQSTTLPVHIYRTSIEAQSSFRTAIAVSGIHVVQVSGSAVEQTLLDNFALQVLQNLHHQNINASRETTRSIAEG